MTQVRVVVIISANIEWDVIRTIFLDAALQSSALGEWFVVDQDVGGQREPVLFFHGGWGKIAAAASTQYVIDRWAPELLINLGTCGGFEGQYEMVPQLVSQPSEAKPHAGQLN